MPIFLLCFKHTLSYIILRELWEICVVIPILKMRKLRLRCIETLTGF